MKAEIKSIFEKKFLDKYPDKADRTTNCLAYRCVSNSRDCRGNPLPLQRLKQKPE